MADSRQEQVTRKKQDMAGKTQATDKHPKQKIPLQFWKLEHSEGEARFAN